MKTKRSDFIMKRKNLTVEQATKKFLKTTKSTVRESTFANYTFTCERHIIPYFKDKEITKLKGEHINEFMQSKLKNGGLDGKPLSPKTVNDMVSILQKIIKEYSNTNITVKKISCPKQEVNIFTKTECKKLNSYVSIGTDSKKLGVVIIMLTGIRIGEMCALKWEDINLDNGIISITKTLQRIKITGNTKKRKTKIIITDPKTPTSIRQIPIPSNLLNRLREWEFPTNGDTYVLTNTRKYIEPRIFQKYFKKCLQTCEVKDNNVHSLRHTFATTAVSNGVDNKTLSIFLGHSDVSFTMNQYVHPDMEHKRVQIEKIALNFE